MYSALDNNDTLEEERRLFYVGVTRAMSKVYLMYANNRRRMGSDRLYEIVSRFIDEVPEENIEKKYHLHLPTTRKVIGGKAGKEYQNSSEQNSRPI